MKLKNSLDAIKKAVPKLDAQKAKRGFESVAAAKLPNSLEWLYSLGFKIGVFLALKSFLILRYLSLSGAGYLMLFSQLALGIVLMICGALMQNPSYHSSPFRLRYISYVYGGTTLLCSIVIVLKVKFSWEFFQKANEVNWFVDFFSGIWKGMKEVGLSVLFMDCDLWIAVCAFLFLFTLIYAIINQKSAEAEVRSLFNQAHASSDIPELIEDKPVHRLMHE